MNNGYSGIKLPAHCVKQYQIIFHGRFQLQVVNENPGKPEPVNERYKGVIIRVDIQDKHYAALLIKFHFLSIIPALNEYFPASVKYTAQKFAASVPIIHASVILALNIGASCKKLLPCN
ncbi:MAG: hypothetical protein WDO71_13285 [Bacteroidota bacterium]